MRLPKGEAARRRSFDAGDRRTSLAPTEAEGEHPMKKCLILLPLLALSACATPETRLRNGLVGAGLSERMAGCMAGRMIDRLSIVQLRRLQSLASLKEARGRALSVADFLPKVRALHDPEILSETSRAAGACALGL